MKRTNLISRTAICLYLVLTCVVFVGCDADDELACKMHVVQEFPNAIEVKRPTGQKYRWLVLDADSTLWYVETMNSFNAEVSGKEKLFEFAYAR